METDKELKQGFLSTPPEETLEPDFDNWHREKASLRKQYLHLLAVVQLVLLLLYVVAAVAVSHKIPVSHETCREDDEFVYTPAASVDKFQKMELNMHLYKDNPYKGPPSPEVDAAWDKLFTNAYIRLSQDELIQLGRNSTPIPDGSGDFLGALDVYHQLHCVRFIFKYVHQDYYTLRKINVPAPDHINHCIDVLRQVVMCLGDTSISTTTFHNDYPRTWPEFKFEHSCRNWDAIDRWTGLPGRAVDQSDHARMEKWLHNPNFVNTGHFFDGHSEDD